MNEMINPQFSLEGSASRKNGVKRLIFALFSIILQVVLILINVGYLAAYAEWIAIITRGIAILLILWIYNKDTTSAMKMPWLILIMAAPILGTTLYILIGQSHSTKKMRERYEEVDRILFPMLPENRDVQGELE
ncbi:MAG: PLDc N-terminal domain-containing protein, partial [Lachnospiraceae bacterium]|nr:PLDc N-terminal domain-containing protein [Lachnospiraceae bacterium]